MEIVDYIKTPEGLISFLGLSIAICSTVLSVYFYFKQKNYDSSPTGIRVEGDGNTLDLNHVNITTVYNRLGKLFTVILFLVSFVFIYFLLQKVNVDYKNYVLNRSQYSNELEPDLNLGFYQPGTLNITNIGFRSVVMYGYSITYGNDTDCKKVNKILIESGKYDQIYSEFSRTIWFSEPKRMTKVLYIDLYLENSIGEKYISKHKMKVRFDPLESGQLYKEVEMKNWSNNFCS